MKNQISRFYNDPEFKKEIADKFTIKNNSIALIGGFENIIYEVSTDSKKYILRITHSSHRTQELLKGEIEWMGYLLKRDISIIRPITFSNKNFIESINYKGSTFFISKFSKAPGEAPNQKNWNNSLIESFGKEIGKLHSASREYTPTIMQNKRPDWDDNVFNDDEGEISDNLQNIHIKYKNLQNKINKLPKNKDSFGLIHRDIHFGNVMLDINKITILDFDDCAYDWYLNDIAVFLFYSVCIYSQDIDGIDFVNNFLGHFLKGYRQHSKITDEELSKLSLFLKRKEISFYLILSSLPENELYDYEKKFMNGRKEKIEADVPLI
ncbi:MAG: phosphotransferase [bacterium]|nr:phosphotransferase [bacterium]